LVSNAITGTGNVVMSTSPTLVTPVLGAATATSINGLTVSSTTGTLSLANGSTLATSGANSLTMTTTGATNVTFPTSGTLATTGGTVASFSAGSTGFTPNTATTGAVTLAGTLATTNGGTGLTSFTSGGVVYASSTSALATGSALTFDGTNINVTNGVLTSQSATGGTGYVGAIGTAMRLVNLNATGSTDVLGNADISLQTAGSNPIKFNIASSEQMRLTSTGLGIGTSSPGAKLHVQTSAGYNVYFQTSGSTLRLNYLNDAASANVAAAYRANTYTWQKSDGSPTLTLDDSGNLGIGTSSPASKLEVSRSEATAYDATNMLATGEWQRISNPDTTANNSTFLLFNPNSSWSGISGISTGTNSGALAFGTRNAGGNLTERARITSGGDLLVGTASQPTGVGSSRLGVVCSASDYAIGVNSTNATPYGLYIRYTAASPNSTGSSFFYFQDSTTVRAYMQSNGGLANYSGNDTNLSDRREKTNFAPAKSYLDTICAIPVQTFNYIDQSEDDPGLTLGVVAQDVQAVAPELVMESNWGTEDEPKMRLSIYQTDLQYALMKCVQELKAELDSVKAELATLKGQP